jgi:hypothetical protein
LYLVAKIEVVWVKLEELKTNNMARTTGKSGFRMRSSPTKGKLGDFFKGVHSKLQDLGERHEKWKADKISKSNINIKDKMDWKYGRGEFSSKETRRKPGESKYQYDVRMKKQTSKAKTDKTIPESSSESTSSESTTPTSESTSESKSKGEYYAFSGKPGDKFKYRRRSDKDMYEGGYEFQYPKDHPKYKGPDHWETAKTEASIHAINDLMFAAYEGQNLKTIPIQKKSPYNKGISKKYTKQPKGSRGFKMNKNRERP